MKMEPMRLANISSVKRVKYLIRKLRSSMQSRKQNTKVQMPVHILSWKYLPVSSG